MKTWDGQELPSEEVFEAFYLDMQLLIKERREGKLSTQMNFTKNGFKSIIKKLRREMKSFEEGNYKEQIMAVHKRWADVDYWRAIQSRSNSFTKEKYLKFSFDLQIKDLKNFTNLISQIKQSNLNFKIKPYPNQNKNKKMKKIIILMLLINLSHASESVHDREFKALLQNS